MTFTTTDAKMAGFLWHSGIKPIAKYRDQGKYLYTYDYHIKRIYDEIVESIYEVKHLPII